MLKTENTTNSMTCSKCHTIQFSANDISYLHLFGQCWDCDKEAWERKELSLEEFEKREMKANENTGQENKVQHTL